MEQIVVKKEPNYDKECDKTISLPLGVTVKQEIDKDFVDNPEPINIYDIIKSVNSNDGEGEIEVDVLNHIKEQIVVKEEPNNDEGCKKPIMLPLEVAVKQEIDKDFVENSEPVNTCDILKSVNSDGDLIKSEIEVEDTVIFETVYPEVPSSFKDLNKTINEFYHKRVHLHVLKMNKQLKKESKSKEELIPRINGKHVPQPTSTKLGQNCNLKPKEELIPRTDEKHLPQPTSSKLGQNCNRGSRSRKLKTPLSGEELKVRMKRRILYMTNYRAKQSEEEREARLHQVRQNTAKSRVSESEEARMGRLQQMRQHMAERRASESEQARKARLQQVRQYKTKKLATESKQAREARLQQHRQRAAEIRASESEQARKARLQKAREHAAKKRASESEEDRIVRLQQMRQRIAKKRALESERTRKARLQQMHQYDTKRLASESEEARKARLEQKRQYAAKRRASKRAKEI